MRAIFLKLQEVYLLKERVLRILEFDKVRQRLAEYAGSEFGKELAQKISPSVCPEEVGRWQAETTDAKAVWQRAAQVPLGGIFDLRELIKAARIGRILPAEDFLPIESTLRAARLLSKFFAAQEDTVILKALAGRLSVFPELEAEIERTIGPEGTVNDDATPTLRTLRTQIRTLQNRIKDKLESTTRSGENQKYLQDAIVTIRNNRYVIPVKQEYKSLFPGIVHDQSASGATLFIEPMAVVEMNNQLRKAEAEAEEEVFRILTKLSTLVGAVAAEIEEDLQILARLDLAFAKARLSLAFRGTEPVINDRGYIHLMEARHPLLEGEIVPIDLLIGGDFHTLVITGPNTGGKTVALKTAGLFVLMAQAGLHLPARSGSEVSIFHGVYADIGDEQSIEQSLSTFSSHMTNIVSILQEATDEKCLVLLDELGAGTDPTEGATLAIAILESLHKKGVRTVATTHYSDLKVFAYNTPGVQNASVEFDPQTLRPTYRLLIGVPGQSNALAIASRLGLDKEIIAEAKRLISPGTRRVEEMIEQIVTEKRVLEEERRDATALRIRLQKEEGEYRAEVARLKAERSRLLAEAKLEAENLVRETRREMENLLRDLREATPEKQAQVLNTARRKTEEFLDQLTEPQTVPSGEWRGELSPGMNVFLGHLGQHGEVLEVSEDSVHVQVGALRMWVPKKKITSASARVDSQALAGRRREKGQTGFGKLAQNKTQTISAELDLRGLTVDDALAATDKYLDEALLAGLPRVRIIHGKGTGALRSAIADYVKKHKQVKNARWGEIGEGGMGVTVVEF
jgi:DNA mismatch repair protein MutS2